MIHNTPLLRQLCLGLLCLVANLGFATAQSCTLIAGPAINLSLGSTGQETLQPQLFVQSNNCGTLQLTVFDANFQARNNTDVDCNDVGKSLLVSVRDIATNNVAFSRVNIFDALAPQVQVQTPLVRNCSDDLSEAGLSNTISFSDNCGNANVTLIISALSTSVGCTNGIANTITRTIRARDANGNLSAPQLQFIEVQREQLSDVQFPADYTVRTSVSGLCPDEFAPEAIVDAPTINGQPISASCKLLSSSSDIVLPLCNNGRKILREYTILDCCTFERRTGTQVITVIDDVAPGFTAITSPVDALPTMDFDCQFTPFLPSIGGMDACGALVDVSIRLIEISTGNVLGQIVGDGQLFTRSFDLATYPIRAEYTITDQCGNSTSTDVTLIAKDDVPPTVVCDSAVVVSLNQSTTIIDAAVFEGTVNDNCCVGPTRVRRMDDPTFGIQVALTCDDAIAGSVVIVVEVSDCFGNKNFCMRTVTVKNGIQPVITTVPDITLSCTEFPVNTSQGGVPSVTQACESFVLIRFDDVRAANFECNTGEVTRTFVFFGGSDQDTIRVNQTITYTPAGPFIRPQLGDTIIACLSVGTSAADLGFPLVDTGCETYAPALMMPPPVVQPICDQTLQAIAVYTAICSSSTDTFQVRRNIRIIDDVAPTFTSIAGSLDTMISCFADLPADFPKRLPGIADNCNTPSLVDLGFEDTPLGTGQCSDTRRVYSYGVQDDCGNQDVSNVFTITVLASDETPPTLTLNVSTGPYGCLAEINAALAVANVVTASDNCNSSNDLDITFVETEPTTNTPCEGVLSRVYTVRDACGNAADSSFSFSYRNTTPPVIDTANLMGMIYQCQADIPGPATTLLSIQNPATCGGAANNFQVNDTTVDGMPITCSGIVTRTYSATDACGDNTVTLVQRFRVEDTTPPALTAPADRSGTLSPNPLTGTCVPLRIDDIIATATPDNCDGARPATITNDSPYAFASDEDAAGLYPGGLTVVTYIADDGCGNTATDSSRIEVNVLAGATVNCQTSSFVFFNTADSPQLTYDSLIDLFTINFPCSDPLRLKLTLRTDLGSPGVLTEVVPGFVFPLRAADHQSVFSVEIVVSNGLRTVESSCDYQLIDINQLRPINLSGTIVGLSSTVNLLDVTVTRSNPVDAETGIVNSDGSFTALTYADQPTTLSAAYSGLAGAGVTTYDIVRTGRHILNYEQFTDSYDLLAADVNRSGSITSLDLTHMRRVILGIDDTFPSPKQVLSLDATHQFSDRRAPWLDVGQWDLAVTTDVDLDNLALRIVKLGDVNAGQVLRPRSTTKLLATDRYVEAGEFVNLSIRLAESESLAGLQCAFKLESLSNLQLTSEALDVMSNTVNKQLRVSALGEVGSQDEVFQLSFTTQQSGLLSELLRIDDSYSNEAYTNADLQPTSLQLHWQQSSAAPTKALVSPNPFTNAFTISAFAKTPGVYQIAVRDLTGRSFAERRINVETTSAQSLDIETANWPAGIYMLTVDGPTGSTVQRIVLQR